MPGTILFTNKRWAGFTAETCPVKVSSRKPVALSHHQLSHTCPAATPDTFSTQSTFYILVLLSLMAYAVDSKICVSSIVLKRRYAEVCVMCRLGVPSGKSWALL